MISNLKELLDIIGRLDDAPDEDTPRERFRRLLKEKVVKVGQLRDYFEECMSRKGDQYNRGFQDLVNRCGEFLGFEVAYGRYNGSPNYIGFDGLWKSPTGMRLVVEVKTSEVYPTLLPTLVGYIDRLISEKEIEERKNALGLYVIGRPDPRYKQISHAISAENLEDRLRLVSADNLLYLAEMIDEGLATHEDVLAVLKPSGPSINPIVELLARIMARRPAETPLPLQKNPVEIPSEEADITCWLAPVGPNGSSADETIRNLVGKGSVYALGDRSPARKQMKAGDLICFYACGLGIVGHATLSTEPSREVQTTVPIPEQYPWKMLLKDVSLWIEDPMPIDLGVRRKMDAFRGYEADASWGWLLKMTRRITRHDFDVLVRKESITGRT